ncbi:MAG: lactonase family protein [Fuerstiella sp.]|nr:lactonase family protein [Fuerstiella sp.]MCP4785581.1 lactonase family protein [Fuerstiella sp.]MCP4853643.1 lactonase family protein [Fuerstiella sp.]
MMFFRSVLPIFTIMCWVSLQNAVVAGNWLFVSLLQEKAIVTFERDVETGTLIRRGRTAFPAEPAILMTPDSHHPRHLMLHPSDRWAYTSDEAGDSISVYDVAPTQATLKLKQTVSSIPADFDGSKNSTARCEITPDGRFIYVANRGHDSIAGFMIDQSSGMVRSLGQFSTEPTPRSFSISADGRHLYAAGQASGRLVVYRIGETGGLEDIGRFESGPVSWSALCVDTAD